MNINEEFVSEELLCELLEKGNEELADFISGVSNPYLLHIIAGNYNWDNGFEVPKSITDNINCDLGTALMIFELSDGYTYLFGEKDEFSSKEWEDFVRELKIKIENDFYTNKSIKYVPELSRAVTFKLKKTCPDIIPAFIEGTNGEEIEILSISV